MKSIVFLGDSLARLRDFPDQARSAAGYQLREVQKGHAFQKKTQQTSQKDIDLAASRLRAWKG